MLTIFFVAPTGGIDSVKVTGTEYITDVKAVIGAKLQVPLVASAFELTKDGIELDATKTVAAENLVDRVKLAIVVKAGACFCIVPCRGFPPPGAPCPAIAESRPPAPHSPRGETFPRSWHGCVVRLAGTLCAHGWRVPHWRAVCGRGARVCRCGWAGCERAAYVPRARYGCGPGVGVRRLVQRLRARTGKLARAPNHLRASALHPYLQAAARRAVARVRETARHRAGEEGGLVCSWV